MNDWLSIVKLDYPVTAGGDRYAPKEPPSQPARHLAAVFDVLGYMEPQECSARIVINSEETTVVFYEFFTVG